MLTLYRRHKPTCSHFSEGRGFHHCKCAIWADGVLGGCEVRKSLRTRDWTKANREIQRWEAAETISTTVPLSRAWESMIADLEARNLSHRTVRKYKTLRDQMTAFGQSLQSFTVDEVSRFRNTWKDAPRTSAKKMERLRAFFRFCIDRNWIAANPARSIKNPKVTLAPTLPLSNKEMLALLAQCDANLLTVQSSGKLGVQRLKTLILVMRYSGLRISDAVTLSTEQVDGNKLFLRMAKTGEPVRAVLPPFVLRALMETPRVTETLYFWSGNGKTDTVVGDYQEKMKNLFDDAGIKKGLAHAVSHRLRDTFAVELLQARVPLERVSILLGHQSIRVTERHYAPWTSGRQQQLDADLTSAWKHDALLAKMVGTKQVQIQNGWSN